MVLVVEFARLPQQAIRAAVLKNPRILELARMARISIMQEEVFMFCC